jgi:Ser/Thr protein kinase RdoA (MazF antagonist)
VSTQGFAHGLDGTLVESDWPVLTRDEVASLLTDFPELGPPFEILTVSPRPFSAASTVAVGTRRVFVKRHARQVRGREGLLEEHRFIAHLRARGIAVPEVLADRFGETAFERGEWTYEVHAVPTGVDAYIDAISWTPFRSVAHARSAGKMLARMHREAEGYAAAARAKRQLVAGFSIFASQDPKLELDRYLASRAALKRYLDQRECAAEALDLLAPFHAELLPILRALAPLWTHNDLHGSNLFWSSDGHDATATAVIDFGLCDRTNAVHDLAHAIERSIVEWLVLVNDPARPENVPVHFDHLWALLDGYESVRELSREEATALAPMLALCHAEFALSEADYFLSILRSEEKAYMACEGWLVGHAQWFLSDVGRNLLDALRHRARAHARPAHAGAVR